MDHALDVPEILSRFPVPLVGSESLETLMSLHGMPKKVAVCRKRTSCVKEYAVPKPYNAQVNPRAQDESLRHP